MLLLIRSFSMCGLFGVPVTGDVIRFEVWYVDDDMRREEKQYCIRPARNFWYHF